MNRPRKKWEDCKVFLMCTLLVLLLPFGFLFFFIPGKILDAIRMRQYRKRRERTRWQPPVSGEDFLRGCGISPDSLEAEVALGLRWKLAQAASAWCHKITAEEIAPDMTCGELVLGWSSYMYWHDGLDSIGYEAVKKLGKGKIPEEVFPRLIRPEKKSRVTMRELFRNYLDVLMPYLGARFSSLYLWSDAWILTALLLQDRSPIPLGSVIFAADWLNHAIPTPYEVNHALTMLSANGFLTLDANRNLLLTDRAKVFKNDSFLKARHFNKIDVIHQELMLNPPLSCLSVNEFFTQDDIKHAREEFARERRSGGQL